MCHDCCSNKNFRYIDGEFYYRYVHSSYLTDEQVAAIVVLLAKPFDTTYLEEEFGYDGDYPHHVDIMTAVELVCWISDNGLKSVLRRIIEEGFGGTYDTNNESFEIQDCQDDEGRYDVVSYRPSNEWNDDIFDEDVKPYLASEKECERRVGAALLARQGLNVDDYLRSLSSCDIAEMLSGEDYYELGVRAVAVHVE